MAPSELMVVLFGDGPLPQFSDGAYFEVCIDAVQRGEADGMVIGVTTQLPDPSLQLPLVADEVGNSWSLGYDGRAHVDGGEEMIPINWNPKDLKVGDAVGLLIRGNGDAQVFVNRILVATLPGKVATGDPLYGFI